MLPVITIPFGAPSVHQRSTDLGVRLGLAAVSVSALHGMLSACPAPSQPMADGPSRETRCRATASPHVFSAFIAFGYASIEQLLSKVR